MPVQGMPVCRGVTQKHITQPPRKHHIILILLSIQQVWQVQHGIPQLFGIAYLDLDMPVGCLKKIQIYFSNGGEFLIERTKRSSNKNRVVKVPTNQPLNQNAKGNVSNVRHMKKMNSK